MSKRKEAVLDLTGCKTWDDLHQRIKKSLDFLDFYGENWSAFNDSLIVDCDVEFITIIGESTLPKNFKKQIEIMNSILEKKKAFCLKYNWPFDYEIVS